MAADAISGTPPANIAKKTRYFTTTVLRFL